MMLDFSGEMELVFNPPEFGFHQKKNIHKCLDIKIED